ncbi:hypothetical protein NDI44_12995 [Trichocoleus sp. DQ-A3]|uniref:hypothetical protein n=1 Tax=Cyanophyceae TaxID=3028117 RepID=UPI001683A11D|nr:hypothetical protein [Coleofasciculus sp. FACHB-125]MBD1900040.1 hypothetical protein [Coleofasciculus sp. FACHB-125]
MRTDSFSARLTPRFAVFMPKGLYAIALVNEEDAVSCLRMPGMRSPEDKANVFRTNSWQSSKQAKSTKSLIRLGWQR